MTSKLLYIVFVTVLLKCEAKQGFGPGEQDWGYVTVREKAHIFWWLFETTASTDPTDRPLIIWLQGGPGGSSTGFGNFREIGPLTLEKTDRESAWTNFANVLFVDNPVGSGFSYVENTTLLANTNEEIADDFLVFLKSFLEIHPEYKSVPIYIFGQSYGGKMAVDIALSIIEDSKSTNSNINLQGIGLGNSWVSPMDSLKSWSPFLHNLGFVDEHHAQLLNQATGMGQSMFDDEQYSNVTMVFLGTQTLVRRYVGRVDFYNVMNQIEAGDDVKFSNPDGDDYQYALPRGAESTTLNNLMNNQVADALGINQTWGEQANEVFRAVRNDFMKSVTEGVEKILNETDLTVTIYNGQLDLIVPTIGTEKWVENLNWTQSESWKADINERTPMIVDGNVEGYEKTIGNLQFFWVNSAGHSVPADNPRAMEYILRKATSNFTIDIDPSIENK